MYIIWKYDQFPYALCGKVDTRRGDNGATDAGYFHVEGYDGFAFEPTRIIVNDKKGAAVQKLIDSIRQEKRAADAELTKKFNEQYAEELLKILGL